MSELMKKRKARKMRKNAGQIYVSDDYTSLSDKPMYEGHQPSTHLMVSDIENNDSGEYHVWPSIGLDDKGKYKFQTPDEAFDKGEVFTFKNKKRAQRFEQGSWKPKKFR